MENTEQGSHGPLTLSCTNKEEAWQGPWAPRAVVGSAQPSFLKPESSGLFLVAPQAFSGQKEREKVSPKGDCLNQTTLSYRELMVFYHLQEGPRELGQFLLCHGTWPMKTFRPGTHSCFSAATSHP